jgi:hypothetical protein
LINSLRTSPEFCSLSVSVEPPAAEARAGARREARMATAAIHRVFMSRKIFLSWFIAVSIRYSVFGSHGRSYRCQPQCRRRPFWTPEKTRKQRALLSGGSRRAQRSGVKTATGREMGFSMMILRSLFADVRRARSTVRKLVNTKTREGPTKPRRPDEGRFETVLESASLMQLNVRDCWEAGQAHLAGKLKESSGGPSWFRGGLLP